MSQRHRLFDLVILWAAAAAACVPEGRDPTDVGDGQDQVLTVDEIAQQTPDGAFFKLAPVEAPDGAARVVALIVLAAPGDAPTIEARLRRGSEIVGDWVSLDVTWSEEDHHVAVADFQGVGDAVELRVPQTSLELLTSLRWSVAASAPEPAPEEIDGVDTTGSGLRAELGDLSIVTRSQWGAASASCSMTSDPNKYRVAIHHTEGPTTNPERQLRSIQQFHASKGWCDVGYHFLIDVDGTIYEGRELSFRGVHSLNNNTGNIGISHIGDFHTSTPPTVMLASTARLVERLSSIYGIDLSRTYIKGHREYSSTDCPGDRLFPRLSDIIDDARALRVGTPPPPPPPPPPATGGASCAHSFGGSYSHLACSAEYQCCDGAWRTQTSGCGACLCTEVTGQTGCQGSSVPPPPTGGASCTHSFGGQYAHLACSTSYQCCGGSWRERAGGGCGTCLCEEGTGTIGCGSTGGGTTAPPMSSDPYAGLTLSGSEIPRAGLTNPTLRAVTGSSTEPLGTVVTYNGASWVRGKMSSFGGPNDTGVSSTETGAVSGERLRGLNSPTNPSASTLASRPEDYYFAAMRWSYAPNSTSFWRRMRFVVANPVTGATIVVRAVDWGPHTRTGRIIDLSPQALGDLGVTTDDDVLVAFAPEGTTLGVVH